MTQVELRCNSCKTFDIQVSPS